MATLKESAESRGTMIFTEKSSGSFIASCSFSQTLQRQRLSSSSRSNGKRVSLQSSDSILSQIGLLIEEDLFSMSAASPHDPFRSLANNRTSVVKEYASTFTRHLDSLLSNSIISNSIHRVAVLLRRDLAKFTLRLQERVKRLLGYKKKKLCISLFFQIYCHYPRKQLAMSSDFFIELNFARSLLVKILLSYSISHTVRREQHSIERDADFHVVIECLKNLN